MKTQSLSVWWLRIATFSVAALAAASAAYWVLKWTAATAAAPQLPSAPALLRPAQTDPQMVARLLGGQKAVVAALSDSAASRFRLLGVVAASASNGYALISVDGKPARPYRVGAAVNDSLVVRSVAPRSAALAPSADAPASFTLELPAPASSEGKPAAGEAKPPAHGAAPVGGETRPVRLGKVARVRSESD
ncbi:MAG: type II secretion system protein N [Rhodoferax sp.]